MMALALIGVCQVEHQSLFWVMVGRIQNHDWPDCAMFVNYNNIPDG